MCLIYCIIGQNCSNRRRLCAFAFIFSLQNRRVPTIWYGCCSTLIFEVTKSAFWLKPQIRRVVAATKHSLGRQQESVASYEYPASMKTLTFGIKIALIGLERWEVGVADRIGHEIPCCRILMVSLRNSSSCCSLFAPCPNSSIQNHWAIQNNSTEKIIPNLWTCIDPNEP